MPLLTAPTVEPLELEDAKRACNVDLDITIFDGKLDRLRKAARYRAETYTHRSLLKQTWIIALGDRPGSTFELSRGKCLGGVIVKYYDSTNTQQTASNTLYTVDVVSEPGVVTLNSGSSWPQGTRFTVQFDSGFGTNPANVPEDIKNAMEMMIETWFDNRGNVLAGVSERYADYPAVISAERLLFPYKVR